MKISELKKHIEDNIVEILSETDPKTQKQVDDKIQQDPSYLKKIKDATAKAEKGDSTDLTMAIAGLKEAEEALMEMASFYKVKDKAGFKSALAKYKEAKGDKFDKGALGKLLSTLDKDGEVDLKALSKETGKDIATYNNPQTRGALEKEGGEFTDYLEAGKGEKAPKEKAEDKPKAEPKKAEKKAEPKKEKPAPKKEEPKKAEKVEDEDEDSTDEKVEDEAELKKIDKEEKKYSEDIIVKFNKLKDSVEKNKDDLAKVKAIINQIGKEKFKLPKKLLDDLKRIANISTED